MRALRSGLNYGKHLPEPGLRGGRVTDAFSFGQRRFEYPVSIHMEMSGKQLIVESKAQLSQTTDRERKSRFSSYQHRINKVKTEERKGDQDLHQCTQGEQKQRDQWVCWKNNQSKV